MSLETTGAPPAASPTAENETENDGAVASEGSTTAESSNAGEDDGAHPAPNLLDVVKSAVEKEDEAEAASPTAEGKVEDKPAEAEAKPDEGDADAKQAEADAKLPFHEHPRWKEVIGQNRELREEAQGLRDDAGRFREVAGFMQANSLTGEEVTEGFAVMADLKSGDPDRLSKAREYLASRLAYLDDALGHKLPEDLQERVDAGLVDVDTAQELAAKRAADKLRATQTEHREKVDAEKDAREKAVATATACATAVDDWEKQQRQSDPDYAKKAQLVETTIRAIVQETGKLPQTPEQAVQLAQDALKRVNDQFKGLMPRPKPVRPSPTGSSAQAAPQPKTLRDAIKASIEG